ncbi:MAG: rhodanese-like domain-containing protein [Sutterella parvirubra]|nr:rhodanese-like domain-containing protein [Sutterella parvirubra]
MRLRHAALALSLAAGLLVGQAHALEPVNPQPATPLTYSNPPYHKITPQVAKKMMEEGNVVILDVRNPDEIRAEGKIKGSVNVPLGELRPGVKLQAAPDLNQKILVHCRSGVRAEKASQILIETGYKDVYNFYGTMQWPYELVK